MCFWIKSSLQGPKHGDVGQAVELSKMLVHRKLSLKLPFITFMTDICGPHTVKPNYLTTFFLPPHLEGQQEIAKTYEQIFLKFPWHLHFT